MKKLILKWLLGYDIDAIWTNILWLKKYFEVLGQDIAELKSSLDSRKIEIGIILETLQNLDNNDVIMNLHKRITELENAK